MLIAASATTAIGIAMAAAGAAERAGSAVGTALVVAVTVAVTVAAHLLPAISRSVAGRALWLVCIALTLYNHAAFFTAEAGRAGAGRAATVADDTRTAALREQLAALPGQTAAAAADALATARSKAAALGAALAHCDARTPGRCASASAAAAGATARAEAAAVALQAARQADALRAELATAAGTLDARRSAAAVDPVSSRIGSAIGLQADAIQTISSVASAAVIDLLAALLWAMTISRGPAHAQARSHADPRQAAAASAHAVNHVTRQGAQAARASDGHQDAAGAAPDWRTHQASDGLRRRLPTTLRTVLAAASTRRAHAARLAPPAGAPATEQGPIRAAPIPSDVNPRMDIGHPEKTEAGETPAAQTSGDGGNIRSIQDAARRAAAAMKGIP